MRDKLFDVLTSLPFKAPSCQEGRPVRVKHDA